MFYEDKFDKSMLDCSLVIIEKELLMNNDTYSTLYHYFDIVGDDKMNKINFTFDIDKIESALYEFEIRRNDEDNTLVYSSELNNASTDFINLTNTFNMSFKDINELAEEMSWGYITINRPFIHTKEKAIIVEDIYINYEVIIEDGKAYQAKITNMSLKYFIHDWLPMVKNIELGQIDDVDKFNIPDDIQIVAKKFKTHFIYNHSFSLLWLYRYYTGDIFIINIEPKGNVKNKMFQYYVVAHLHICNNSLGNCHPDCVSNWYEPELDSLNRFLLLESKYLDVKWYPDSTIIEYRGTPMISQTNDCCFIDKSQINFNIY